MGSSTGEACIATPEGMFTTERCGWSRGGGARGWGETGRGRGAEVVEGGGGFLFLFSVVLIHLPFQVVLRAYLCCFVDPSFFSLVFFVAF